MKTKSIILIKLILIISFAFYYSHSLKNYFSRSDVNVCSASSIKYIEHIIEASRVTGVNPALIAAVISMESNFKPNAQSYAGAKGLMQINGITARYLKLKDVFDPKSNIHAGTNYLSELSNKFGNRLELVLAAYNAGPGAVKKFKGIPPYKETKNYVKKVMQLFHLYKSHPDLSKYI